MLERIFRERPLLRVYYKGILKFMFRFFGRTEGVRVMDENWDYLIILDACRYDSFKEVNWIKGNLKKKISLGSHTEEWARENFQGDYSDTVYVSGNPQISKVKCKKHFGKVPFFKIEEVWDYGWDEEEEYLPPRVVSSSALEISEKYPEKRFIIHYLQPHWPFPPESELSKSKLDSIRLELDKDNLIWKLTGKFSRINQDLALALKSRKRRGGNIWAYLRNGDVSVDKAKAAYKENLKKVLEEVEELTEKLEGKKIVTSDHGNLFGERWIYGHPLGFRIPELIEIPWLEVEETN